jgi:hypothetical protein
MAFFTCCDYIEKSFWGKFLGQLRAAWDKRIQSIIAVNDMRTEWKDLPDMNDR